MHDLQAYTSLFKYITIAVFHIYAQSGEEMKMPLKEAMHLIVMGITLLIMEKSWNCVFEFLWVPGFILEKKLLIYIW